MRAVHDPKISFRNHIDKLPVGLDSSETLSKRWAMTAQTAQTRSYVRATMAEALLDPKTELALAVAWRDKGDRAALDRLIRAHSRLAVSIAARFRRYAVPFEDLVQQGNLGLMRAAEKFDPENGARFSTYAAWWIRASIQEYVMRNWSMVRTGTNAAQKKLFFHIRRLIQTLDDSEAPDAIATRIARALDVPEAEVEAMIGRMSGPDLSLDVPQNDGGEGGRDWVDTLADETAQTEDAILARIEDRRRRALLKAAVSELPDRERHIVIARHFNDEQQTLTELGAELGISKERVRQLEERAIARMRSAVMRMETA